MKTIPVTDIIIENRQRRLFDEKKIAALSDSIKAKGLLHPVVLRDDGKTLVAGERRIRAIKLLYDLEIPITCGGQPVPLGHIPYLTTGELSEDDYMEAELEENVLREDLTWQEYTQAVKALHELRARQNPAQTVTETASEIVGHRANSQQISKVQKALALAENLDDPEIQRANSLSDAFRKLRRKKEEEHQRKLAERFKASGAIKHTVLQGNFRENLPPEASIDVLLTDPPYGIGADDFGSMNPGGHVYDDSEETFKELLTSLAEAAASICKPRAHLYIFHDLRWFDWLEDLFTQHGWTVWHMPLIWVKGETIGVVPLPDHSPRRTYEAILYAWRNDKPLTGIYADTINIPGLVRTRFAAEKPSQLYLNLLRRSCRPGDQVWDPFAGSGPIIPAANSAKVTAFATELSEEKYKYILTRLTEKAGDAQGEDLEELFAE